MEKRWAERLADRRVTSWVRRRLIDGLLPPVVRDLRPLNWAANRAWLGRVPLDFQRRAWSYGEREWSEIWRAIAAAPTASSRESDTSEAEMAWICDRVAALAPARVLEVGAGRGLLARRVLPRLPEGATLYVREPFAEPVVPSIPGREVVLLRDPARALPFKEGEIDLLICSHTLEHLTHLISTFAEFRRVARRSLIVVPLQRWAPYTWDLHLHFFPYLEYLPGLLELPAAAMQQIDGDGCYEFDHG
jgi:SAM-dependent methyltransferase